MKTGNDKKKKCDHNQVITNKSGMIICLSCNKEFGYLIDILDHAVLRDEAEAKVAQMKELLEEAYDVGYSTGIGCRTDTGFEGWLRGKNIGADHIVDDNKKDGQKNTVEYPMSSKQIEVLKAELAGAIEGSRKAEARVKELEEENKQVLAQFLELQKSWQIASLEHFALTNKVSETESQLASQQAGPKQGEKIEVKDHWWDWSDAHTREFICFDDTGKVWARSFADQAWRYDNWRPIQPKRESVEELQRLGRLV